ncbi:hypothetical protein DAI22_04g116000 [Oryza sativa Japonica Group]|nr:hypothetical protein DAI22_04g116000 [Oryza sativa Japonica Group]
MQKLQARWPPEARMAVRRRTRCGTRPPTSPGWRTPSSTAPRAASTSPAPRAPPTARMSAGTPARGTPPPPRLLHPLTVCWPSGSPASECYIQYHQFNRPLQSLVVARM